MSNAKLKSHKRWLLYRIYTPVAMAAWVGGGLLSFSGTGWMLYTLITFPLAVPAFLMFFTLGAFRFDYSCFGRHERTPWPAEDPIPVEKTAGGRVGLIWGWLPASLFAWMLYPSGLGIRIPFCGKAFVPLNAFGSLGAPSGGFRHRLIHDSPEVRNPISIPSKGFAKAIEQLLNERQGQIPAGAQTQSLS
jgi:hypothetical protein